MKHAWLWGVLPLAVLAYKGRRNRRWWIMGSLTAGLAYAIWLYRNRRVDTIELDDAESPPIQSPVSGHHSLISLFLDSKVGMDIDALSILSEEYKLVILCLETDQKAIALAQSLSSEPAVLLMSQRESTVHMVRSIAPGTHIDAEPRFLQALRPFVRRVLSFEQAGIS